MRLVPIALLLALASTAHAAGDPGGAALAALQDRVAADVRAGRPLVVQAHVALCSNDTIRCGGHGLGDGDSLEKNLYWATSGGARGWFSRKNSGWTLAHRGGGDGSGLLAVDVWKRRVQPNEAWRARGVSKPFDAYVVAYAWRGGAIDEAVRTYLVDLFGDAPRPITLDDGTKLAAGGAAQLVAWVGHDRWMDYDRFDWAGFEALEKPGAPSKGVIAVACMTYQYLAQHTTAQNRIPLLYTRDFVFAGSHALDGAVLAFLDGRSLDGIRRAGAQAYADGERKPIARVGYAFVNPSDKKWTVPMPEVIRASGSGGR